MKRYALFTFETYYPLGGWNDFKGTFDTVEEAVTAANQRRRELYQIVDLTTGKVVVE